MVIKVFMICLSVHHLKSTKTEFVLFVLSALFTDSYDSIGYSKENLIIHISPKKKFLARRENFFRPSWGVRGHAPPENF